MQNAVRCFINRTPFTERPTASLAPFSHRELSRALAFHRSMPDYAPTPLHALPALSRNLGVESVHVKDESQRFGLKAFKALGSAHAMARHIAERLGKDIGELPFAVMAGEAVREEIGEITFVTATDGNHGRGVAWMARRLRQKAVVYLPGGSSPERLDAIRREGARAEIVDMNYDEAVRMAARRARERGWTIVQDTAWPGYEKIPLWIMQGYGTLMLEALEQLRQRPPTHVFAQAGVGSFAGMAQGMLAAAHGENRPRVIVAEARAADCLYRSAVSEKGWAVPVGGDLQTLMAGLACGEANPIAWELLRDYASAFASCTDSVALLGMRLLGRPLPGDPPIVSGESGAVTAGLLALLMRSPDMAQTRSQLALDENSRVLLISTEGDTDPRRYREIVEDERSEER
ncbi:MAG: diaminopropionate ammonia-lyase [Candidatus Accumulibacter sp.]|jgi:diaminopropionate ammonia-lyase|nr:diaminopropionate ammonia-lyase [Accumulibacter sp.]